MEFTMNQVTTIDQETQTRAVVATPMEMIAQAINQGMDISVIDKLMTLQERYEANQGRKAFDKAIAAAKSEFKPVGRNRTGHQNKRYADFEAYASMIDPIIVQYGLSYRFETDQSDTLIRVTCVVAHEDGHSIRNTLAAAADTSGSKNSIQAIGSTLTYLQRYTLVQAFGLAATDDDDGGKSDAPATITENQLMGLRELIEATRTDAVKLCQYFKIDSLQNMPSSQYDRAVSMIQKKGK